MSIVTVVRESQHGLICRSYVPMHFPPLSDSGEQLKRGLGVSVLPIVAHYAEDRSVLIFAVFLSLAFRTKKSKMTSRCGSQCT